MAYDLDQALADANKIFGQMCNDVEARVSKGDTKLDVLTIAHGCGLTELDARVLDELQVEPIIHVQRWLPYHIYWPWRPLWCWWWRRWPWYKCCPYWWHRCHWYYPY